MANCDDRLRLTRQATSLGAQNHQAKLSVPMSLQEDK